MIRIEVEPAMASLDALGQPLALTARAVWNTGRVAPAAPVTWASSNPEAIQVSVDGIATGVRNGTAQISATGSGLTGSSLITVAQVATQIQVGVDGNPILPGETLTLTATAQDALGSPLEPSAFEWRSSNPLIATVDGMGVTTGRAPGKVTISAATGHVVGSAELHVVTPALTADTIFIDDFQSGGLASWEDGVSAQLHRVVPDPTNPSSGKQVLEITYPQGADGGWLTRFFMPGYDSIHVSYRVRLDPNWQGATKFLALYGSRANDRWSAFGKAGVCPNGTDFFTTMVTMEDASGNPPPLRFYTYHPEMNREPDGVTCWGRYGDGSETYVTPLTLVPGQWHDISFYVRLNDPGVPNGMQRFWLDGELRAEWAGIRFRDTDTLRLNAVQLSANASRGAPQLQRVWVDEVVVTTRPTY